MSFKRANTTHENGVIMPAVLTMDFYRRLTNRIIVLLVLIFLSAGDIYAGGRENLRAWAGLELFPSLLAADLDITKKQGDVGELLLLLLYKDRNEVAETMAIYLNKIKEIQLTPIRIEITSIDSFLQLYESKRPAGIFLTQRFKKKELETIIAYGGKRQAIIFSPFEGDVEKGVHAGIDVSEKVLPYLNKRALQRSKIRIKPFFLKIAELYE